MTDAEPITTPLRTRTVYYYANGAELWFENQHTGGRRLLTVERSHADALRMALRCNRDAGWEVNPRCEACQRLFAPSPAQVAYCAGCKEVEA